MSIGGGMAGAIIVAVIIGGGFFVLAGTIWYVIAKIKAFARKGFGTDNLDEILRQQDVQLNEPKSVSGMTSVYLPKLQADFPELNWAEMQETARGHIKDYLAEKGFDGVRFHRTVLNEYKKKSGTCYATIQTSLQYNNTEGKTVQTRYNCTMAYVQDAEPSGFKKAYSITCPNCGAAVTSLGNKTCEYCGSAIQEISRRVWELNGIEEV